MQALPAISATLELTIAALIGHKGHSITSRYVHTADAVLLAAADAVADHTLALMGERKPAAVIPLRRGRQQSTGDPEPAGYEQLVERLLDLQRRGLPVAPLDSASEALVAVLGFLSADARLMKNEALQPLWRLFFAVMDRQRKA